MIADNNWKKETEAEENKKSKCKVPAISSTPYAKKKIKASTEKKDRERNRSPLSQKRKKRITVVLFVQQRNESSAEIMRTGSTNSAHERGTFVC